MLSSALAFLAGICLLLCCHELPGAGWLSLIAATALLGWSWPPLRWPALAAAGFCWVGWHAAQLSLIQLPDSLEARDVQVRGQVVGLPQQLAQGHLRLRFRVDSVHNRNGWRDLVLPARLNWYRDAPAMRPGERWQLQVRLKAAHGLANPGGFDYECWLFAHGLRATGYVRKSPANRLIETRGVSPLQRLREHLSAHLKGLDLGAPQRALLRALTLGDRGGMSSEQWQLLQHTGTSHLLAISGLHVGLVATLVFVLVERLWSRLGGAHICAAPRAAALAAMAAALAYALLAGFQVPAQRALVMISAWAVSILLTGRARPWPVFGLALWLVLLLDPLSVLGAGFWLSFTAVALILYLSQGRHGRGNRFAHLWAAQLGLVAGLTPLLWLWFQQASLSAPLANLIAIPWVSFLVVPVLLLGLLLLPVSQPLADGLFHLAAMSLDGLWVFLQRLDFGSLASWPAPPLTVAALVLFCAGLLAVLLPVGTGVRLVAVVMLLPGLAVSPSRPAAGDLWVTLLDVGQGLAVVVETHRHLLVYDTGPAFPGGFDSGASVLVPFLHHRGYDRVDRLVISHADNDHSGGGASLFQQLPVYSVHSGEPGTIRWAYAKACRAQPGWQWDGVRFEYLPTTGIRGNNASCVLKITPGDGRGVLLPGDIEHRIETELVDNHARQLGARVLVAPHHGSRTSSGARFIRAVNPDWVLFATGYRNRFGFPRPDVVARYAAAGTHCLDTARAGAIVVSIETGHAVRVEPWRPHHRQLWRDPG